MRFVPYYKLDHTPNIIVDGKGADATRVTLSHWPHSGTPQALKADTSVESTFLYLDDPAMHVEADIVSNNHFDEDGLAGVWTLLKPALAQEHRSLLVDIGSAGDFGVYQDRTAARIALTIAAYSDSATSPLAPAVFESSYEEKTGRLYEELLPLMPDLLTDPQRYRAYWEADDALVTATEKAIAGRKIVIEYVSDIDLAVVELPGGDWPLFSEEPDAACHTLALHSTLGRRGFRILMRQGAYYEVRYRYETWVQYMTRPPVPRVDLTPLAEKLNGMESQGAVWTFDGVEKITPSVHVSDGRESTIAFDAFRRELEDSLRNSPPAWNPYD